MLNFWWCSVCKDKGINDPLQSKKQVVESMHFNFIKSVEIMKHKQADVDINRMKKLFALISGRKHKLDDQ